MLLTDIYLGTMSLTVALSHLPLLYRSFAVLRTIHVSMFSNHVGLSVFFVCSFVCLFFIAVVTSLFKTVTGQRTELIENCMGRHTVFQAFSSVCGTWGHGQA